MKNTLKVQRAMHNMTQQDLADKISVSRQTINAMEANKYVPSTLLALKIARLFEKPVEDIFLLEESDQ
ncbi:MAG: helix-turn-helix transcriptional regulator [Flavisolibacter sp.]